MNKIGVKLFLFAEGVLLLLTLYQLIRNYELLFLLVGGAVLVKIAQQNKKKQTFLQWVGWFMIIMSVLSVFTVWLMLGVSLLFLVIQGNSKWEGRYDAYVDVPWKKKQYLGIKTEEPTPEKKKRKKQKWLGSKTIGKHVYEWDDINLSILMGDTIIDLGNTLLPDGENVILVRKGLGQTRVIVPMGIGVAVNHSAVQGNLIFDGEVYPLANEKMTVTSEDYETANRRVKIVSNILLGDFEVIYL